MCRVRPPWPRRRRASDRKDRRALPAGYTLDESPERYHGLYPPRYRADARLRGRQVPRCARVPGRRPTLTTSMKAVGGALGRSPFAEHCRGLPASIDKGGVQFHWDSAPTPRGDQRALSRRLPSAPRAVSSGSRLFVAARRSGVRITKIDPWFLDQMFPPRRGRNPHPARPRHSRATC